MVNKICKKIVLTGGQCAGKTEVLQHIKKHFSNLGYEVYIVNEMATILMLGGITPKKLGKEFEELIINMELEMRKTYEKAISISKDRKSLIVFDRGPIDTMMAISREEFDEIIKKFGTTYEEVINSYDVVVHMETVAKKFPEMYTSDNNEARLQSIADSISNENRLLEAYKVHPNRVIISACEDFNEKIKNVLSHIEKIIGY